MSKSITTSYTISNTDHLNYLFDHVNKHLTLMESCTMEFENDNEQKSTKVILPKQIIKSPSQYIATFINTNNPKFVNTNILGQICPICVECFMPKETYHLLSCNHYFHAHCIEEWLMNDLDELSCPLCRQSQYNDEK